jgi:hypothetical protein
MQLMHSLQPWRQSWFAAASQGHEVTPTKGRRRSERVGKRGFGKAQTNEENYPHIVELAIGKGGLDVELGRRILNFHKSRHIKLRHGQIILKADKTYYRWCFSDPAIAHTFIEQFGGSLGEPNRRTRSRRRL